MMLAKKTVAAALLAAMTLGLLSAPAHAEEAAASSWQLRGQVRMRSGSGLSDPRTISGATDLL
jgi:hypothetical protein